MKRQTTRLLCFYFMLSILGSSCKDKDDPSPGTLYLSQDLKDYAYFKVGTWWVYEEETSHDFDSVYLYSSLDTIITFDGSSTTPDGTYESIDMNAHSFYDEYNYNMWANTTWPTIGGKRALNTDKFKPGDYVGETVAFFDHAKLNDFMGTYINNGKVTLVELQDSMIISNNIFHGVRKFYDNSNSNEHYSPTNYYYSKNIGLIRKEVLSTNKVWNLVRYHIVQ
jgi:hypothetical protein